MSLDNSTSSKKRYVNLKFVSTVGPCEKDEAPFFVLKDENFTLTDEKFSKVSGKVTKIESSFSPAKGKMGDIYGFTLYIEDSSTDDIYAIDSTITNASKGLLNAALANVGKEVSINAYLNKNMYPTTSMRDSDGEFALLAIPDFKSVTTEKLFELIPKEGDNEARQVTPPKRVRDDSEINIEDIPF